jgi:hypothetical protein
MHGMRERAHHQKRYANQGRESPMEGYDERGKKRGRFKGRKGPMDRQIPRS